MRKQCPLIFLCMICILLFTGCSVKTYSEDDFLGKSSAEIEQQYGSFDCIGMPAGEDGLYRNTSCGYTIREARKGFLGTTPEELFFISFDANGTAVRCFKGNRPGG